MKDREKLIELLGNLFGSSFVSIRGYMSATTQELANHVINVGVSYEGSVKKDLALLDSTTFENELMDKARINKFYSMYNNRNETTRNNHSKGQINTYTHINNCVKLKNDTNELYIHGMFISKVVLEVAKKPKKKSENPLVLAGLEVDKALNLSTPKYRMFKFDLLDIVRISGNELILKDVSIVQIK